MRGDGEQDPALAVIAAFDEARARAFGEEARRAWPRSTDPLTAREWLDAGLSVADLGAMLEAVHRKLASNGHAPPEHLRYHRTDVERLLRAKNGTAYSAAGAGSEQIAADAEEASWGGRLRQLRDEGFWLESWGPKPGRAWLLCAQ